eukprot:3569587-Pyramimonas_sp.AAC.1
MASPAAGAATRARSSHGGVGTNQWANSADAGPPPGTFPATAISTPEYQPLSIDPIVSTP